MPALDLAIRIRVERCPIPVVWLDTHVLIRLALLEVGRLDPSLVPAYSALESRLSKLVARNAIVCPKVDQHSEVWGPDRPLFMDKLTTISMGVDMKPKLAIDDGQTWKLMSAYIKGVREVVFSYRDGFYKDPLREIEETRLQRFIVTVDMGVFPSVEKAKAQRESLHKAWEEMRQRRLAEGASYEEQKELERRARFSAVFGLARDAIATVMKGGWPDLNELEGYKHIMTMVEVWDRLGGTPKGLAGLVRFIDSNHYAAHLINDIEATLLARLMTGTELIQSGDEMDIDQIATVLPFADLMIVDRKMRHYLHKLGLADRYGAKVCGVHEWDEINDYLDAVAVPYAR